MIYDLTAHQQLQRASGETPYEEAVHERRDDETQKPRVVSAAWCCDSD